MGRRARSPLADMIAISCAMFGASGAALSADFGPAPHAGRPRKPVETELHAVRVAHVA